MLVLLFINPRNKHPSANERHRNKKGTLFLVWTAAFHPILQRHQLSSARSLSLTNNSNLLETFLPKLFSAAKIALRERQNLFAAKTLFFRWEKLEQNKKPQTNIFSLCRNCCQRRKKCYENKETRINERINVFFE